MPRTDNWHMLIAEEARDFIHKYGHFLAIRKVLPGVDCPCVRNGSPDPSCDLCDGSGFTWTDHIVLGRRYESRPGIGHEQSSPLGQVAAAGLYFMVEPGLDITSNDKVLELVLSPKNREPVRPYKISQSFEIEYAEPKRDLNGRLAFYQIKTVQEAWDRSS